MTFIWPFMLLALTLVPVFALMYLSQQRRGRALAASAAAQGLFPARKRHGSRRHIPALFFMTAVAALLFALARPQTVVSLPRVGGIVMLTFDISGSMRADDVKPTRFEAAKAAAKAFVESAPGTVEIGVIAFSEGGLMTQSPTYDRTQVMAAIDRLAIGRGTSIANGIAAAIKSIESKTAEKNTNFYSNRSEPTPEPTPVPTGFFQPAVVVLLSDGENNVPPDPGEAVAYARDRGIRVHTVGIGTPNGATIEMEGFKIRSRLDGRQLEAIAQATAGTYFVAESVEDLTAIYSNVGTQLSVRPEQTEVTFIFAAAAIALLLIGALLSLFWFGRLV
jgi:Ca-activated chloride channel family protein